MTMQTPAIPGVIHVVDDDAAFRTAISRVLTAAGHRPKLYPSAADYLSSHDPEGPACVVLDLRMPGVTGLDLQAALAQREDSHPVIFLSGHGDIPSTVRAMREGALDFLRKPVPTATLLEAIHRALERDLERTERRAQVTQVKQRYASLTPRERQVMAGVVAGRLNKQICYALHAAERTVKTHRARVMEKMRVRSVAELVRLAEELAGAGVLLETVGY
ncbi:MAG TPA: response regulator [Usitatibacter sp.]|jgi:FixJ family two-component response regulator|nr:response regulator [Usitatibacter sp.]